MEDIQIIDLYFARDEAAIAETASKYGRFCSSVAQNILSDRGDADECVNDAYADSMYFLSPNFKMPHYMSERRRENVG